MNSTIIICYVLFAVFLSVLIAFSVFAIGFLIGYKYEEKRIFKSNKTGQNELQDTEEEKRLKREWKNFLKYDGSTVEKNEV